MPTIPGRGVSIPADYPEPGEEAERVLSILVVVGQTLLRELSSRNCHIIAVTQEPFCDGCRKTTRYQGIETVNIG